MQCLCKTLCILYNRLLNLITDRRSRIYRNTVSGMDTGTLDMLHDTRDENVGSVAYGINLDFLTL